MIDLLKRFVALPAFTAACLFATPAAPLSVILPCESVTESNMWVGPSLPLAGWGGLSGRGIAPTGVVVDGYTNIGLTQDGSFIKLYTHIFGLEDFTGSRVVHCASGVFWAVADEDWDHLDNTLITSKILRPTIVQRESIDLDDLRLAVRDNFPNASEFIETEQTCGCAEYFDSFRPAEQTPFVNRTDGTQ